MSTMDAIKSLGLNTSASANKAKAKSSTLNQEEFLKLMTTQMTHQDPTKPMQNGEFLSQMAQFGTVSGIQDLQKSFNDFATSISSDQALQATGLIGRTVSIPSNEGVLGFKFDGENRIPVPINGSVNLSSSSPTVTLKILDPTTGDILATKSLGGQSSGPVAFEWDGTKANGITASPGVYKVQVEALQDGVNTILQPNIQAKVDSVSMANANHGLQVNVKGLGAFNFNKVTQILNQES